MLMFFLGVAAGSLVSGFAIATLLTALRRADEELAGWHLAYEAKKAQP